MYIRIASCTLLLPPAPLDSYTPKPVSGQNDTREVLGDRHSKLTGAQRPKRRMPKKAKKKSKKNQGHAHTCANTAYAWGLGAGTQSLPSSAVTPLRMCSLLVAREHISKGTQ